LLHLLLIMKNSGRKHRFIDQCWGFWIVILLVHYLQSHIFTIIRTWFFIWATISLLVRKKRRNHKFKLTEV